MAWVCHLGMGVVGVVGVVLPCSRRAHGRGIVARQGKCLIEFDVFDLCSFFEDVPVVEHGQQLL